MPTPVGGGFAPSGLPDDRRRRRWAQLVVVVVLKVHEYNAPRARSVGERSVAKNKKILSTDAVQNKARTTTE